MGEIQQLRALILKWLSSPRTLLACGLGLHAVEADHSMDLLVQLPSPPSVSCLLPQVAVIHVCTNNLYINLHVGE